MYWVDYGSRFIDIKRFFGFGGNLINISYDPSAVPNCYDQSHTTPNIENPLLSDGSLGQCMEALTSDLEDYPNGLQLNLVQCQQFFCTPQFIVKFEEYLQAKPEVKINNSRRFLTCYDSSVEV